MSRPMLEVKQVLSVGFKEALSMARTPDKYVVAYSGGVDSQVLLHLASTCADAPVVAVHCHHGVSEFADDWVSHCQEQAKVLGVELHVVNLDLGGVQSNFESIARDKRYEAIQSFMTDKSVLLTGHHMNDQAETMLMRLLRGSGIDGLSSIAPIRELNGYTVLRPLLGLAKTDLIQYAKQEGITWVEDESNQSSDYDRNFIRNEVLPLIEKRWPGAAKSIAMSAGHCQDAKDELLRVTEEDYQEVVSSRKENALNLQALKRFSQPRRARVLRYWIELNGRVAPGKSCLEFMDRVLIGTGNNTSTYEATCFRIYLYRGMLCFADKEKVKSFELEGFKLRQFKTDKPKLLNVTSAKDCVWRQREHGDKMRYRGHTKSLKKIFQEEGIPSWEREQYPVLECNGEIVAVGNIISSDYLALEGFRIKVN